MKAQLFTILFILSPYLGYAQLPTNGLVAHYTFDRDLSKSDDVITDASTHQNNGTAYGGTSYTEDRYNTGCSALWFDGTGYASIPNSPSLQSPQQQFTASVWFKIGQGADFFNQWITILCKSDRTRESAESPQYRMQATAQTISLNTAFTENFIPQLSYEVWYFYAYVFDGNQVKVFLDGQFVFDFIFQDKLNPNTLPLEIGRDLPGAQEYFYGAMDDLRIYNRALSESELRLIYRDNSGANVIDRCSPPQAPITQLPPPPQEEEEEEEEEIVQIPPPSKPDTINPTPEEISTIDYSDFEELPKELDGIPIQYQKVIHVKNRNITIYPYDNEKEDGDIVSIIVNDQWVKDRYTLKKKKSPIPSNLLIKQELTLGKNNYIISKAWNKGTLGLNTMTLEINDGVSIQNVLINSEEGLSGGIRIICEE